MRCSLVLCWLACSSGALAQTPAEELKAQRIADEQTLTAAGIKVDGPGLLKFFRDRTLLPEEQARLNRLIDQLGHRSYAVREKAGLQLRRAGRLALPLLEAALKSTDQEVVRRADLILREITLNTDAPLVQAAARRIADLKPDQAAETLLEYLPFASCTEVQEEVRNALSAVALRQGQPLPAVVAALQSRYAVCRLAAGEALARNKISEHREAVHALLADPDLHVRLHLAQVLVQAQDRRGIQALIDLLAILPVEDAWQAEETLRQLAGEKSPLASLGVNQQKEVHGHWLKWWKEHGKDLDLAKLAEMPRQLGYTLVTMMSTKGSAGTVMEIGPDKKIRWQINGISYPLDAQIVGNDRVLVTEYLQRRVTERDFQGNILWSYSVNLPIGAQRISHGRTFIATRNQLLILDRTNKEVWTHHLQVGTISAARWLPNGQMIVVNSAGMVYRLDSTGKQLSSFQAGRVYTLGGNIDVLPNGRILIPMYQVNKVAEYTPDGKVTWEANVQWPTSVVRLANGNVLVSCMQQQRIVELNRNGQEVWSFNTDGRPWRARRR